MLRTEVFLNNYCVALDIFWIKNSDHTGGGESRLNFSPKLPHRPPTKNGNFLDIKIYIGRYIRTFSVILTFLFSKFGLEIKLYFIKATMVIRQI